MRWTTVLALGAMLFALRTAVAVGPRDSLPLDTTSAWPRDYRLHVEIEGTGGGLVRLTPDLVVPLVGAGGHDVAVEHPASGTPVLRVWAGGVLARGPEEVPALARSGARDFPEARVRLDGDYTVVVRFRSGGEGTLFARCPSTGKWAPDSKALFIRDGRLVFDIGWLGAMSGGERVDDGRDHVAVLAQAGARLRLWLDGKMVAERNGFGRPDREGYVFKVGRAATDFGGELRSGNIGELRFWQRAVPEAEVASWSRGDIGPEVRADFQHAPASGDGRPVVAVESGAIVKEAWVQPLERTDHLELVQGWNERTLAEGRRIYSTLCVVCHGTKDQAGSLPTALRFAEGTFKNGSDPYSMFVTLTKGYGQMVPQGQYTTAQKYAVIQYIRETFVRPHNPSQWVEMTPTYVAGLPRGRARAEGEKEDQSLPEYQRMDFGPALFWTYEVAPGNIAQKGLAVRLDAGPGGVSAGQAWMVYDLDTGRVAASTTGSFVDWKGIAFDGSHATHTRLTGDAHVVNPVGPGWAGPEGQWSDPRPAGRDGRPYGPLPRNWSRHLGVYPGGAQVVVATEVNGVRVLESPGWLAYGTTPVFVRTLNVGEGRTALRLRVAPESVRVVLRGAGRLLKEGGFWVAELPSGAQTRLFVSRADAPSLEALASTVTDPTDLSSATHGGARRWTGEVTTQSKAGQTGGAFETDDFPLPLENPWGSWMRPGGFDFTPDGRGAVVATWNGDVWRVEGLLEPAPAALKWRRIASGLFQPLGVKYRNGELFVTCRDQLVRLVDLNGDGEVDFVDCFNTDHQVTEHFHEFAMGLQTDAAGNFYYAKSGRHALPAVVPHHGTLLRVSADGSRTDILATGFRAANGVALDEDGSFWVTDQEGFWTPKNRINRVKPGGFYGNLFGYTDVTDASDAAMEPPMVWITNAKDRSPAELVRVPAKTWGSLGGLLLNLSYGTGRAFAVTHEEIGGVWQGTVCELPMPAFATGIMRGRFGKDDALYTCGMFAWAGNATAPGGFHRIRRTDRPAHVPVAVEARSGGLRVRLSEAVDPGSVTAGAFQLRVWSLKRSARYGSNHVDEHPVDVKAAAVGPDGRTLEITAPGLGPTHCYELRLKVRAPDGAVVERNLHGTIHRVP
jgi:cytochrome c5